MAASAEVMEGFLCPICKCNFNSGEQLLTHYQNNHKEEEEDDVWKFLTDFVGKARKKIGLKQSPNDDDNAVLSDYQKTVEQAARFQQPHVPQDLGHSKSHYTTFQALRTKRLEPHFAEVNKLLIRLNKLLVNLPSDAASRKAHEQHVVCWINSTDVKLCPSCANSFHLARRKHHCRLCGGIMCHDCSYFMPVKEARRMTLIAGVEQANSAMKGENPASTEPDLRLCEPCFRLLCKQEQKLDSQLSYPKIIQLYELLREHLDGAKALVEEYSQMYTSLCSGESLYHLQDAQLVRVKLIKLADKIDSTSKVIAVLKSDNGATPTGRVLRLQQAVRSSATNFICRNLVGLPALPSDAQLKVLQGKHQNNFEARLQSASSASSPQVSSRPPQMVGNWIPETASKPLIDSGDVMIEQMNILKSYIKQAKDAFRDEEVAMLESNLRELQEEYWQRQQ